MLTPNDRLGTNELGSAHHPNGSSSRYRRRAGRTRECPIQRCSLPPVSSAAIVSERELQLNPHVNPFQRSFIAEIRRVDDMARRVRFFTTQIEREKETILVRPLYDSAPLLTVGPRAAQTMDELDVKLSEHEKRLNQMNDSYQLLSDRLTELIEAQHVLRETAVFFDRVS